MNFSRHPLKYFFLPVALALFLSIQTVEASGGIRLTNTTNATYFFIMGGDTQAKNILNGSSVTFQFEVNSSSIPSGRYNLTVNVSTNFSNHVQVEVFPTSSSKGLIPESYTFGKPFFINSTVSSEDRNPITSTVPNGTSVTYTMTIQSCPNCNGTWEIFAFMNDSNNVHHNETTHYNLSITLGAAAVNPVTLSPINFTPNTTYTNVSINGTTRYLDSNGLQADIDLTWRVNATIVQTLHMSNVNNNTEITNQLSHTFFNKTHVVNFTVNATDSAGNNLTVTAIITVQNTAPSLNKTFGTQTLYYIETLSADADGFDIDEEVLNWTTNNTIVNVSQQGTVTGTFDETKLGNHSINITVKDQENKNAWFNFTLQILNSSLSLNLNPNSNISVLRFFPYNITACPVLAVNETWNTSSRQVLNTNPKNYSLCFAMNQTLPGGIYWYLGTSNQYTLAINLTTSCQNLTNITQGQTLYLWDFMCYDKPKRGNNSQIIMTSYQI